MNIFCTSDDPVACARALDDVRVNKMIVETAQLLSQALYRHGVRDDRLYKPLQLNNPFVLWTAASRTNYDWLFYHFEALLIVKNSFHSTGRLLPVFRQLRDAIPVAERTPFYNGTIFKDDPDTCRAYRRFMNVKWANDVIRLTWRGRGKPDWYEAVQ